MKKSSILILSLLLFASFYSLAHLCNDVFDQAKDDLAVKVDIRDGQLRINKEASFRVYLLNTMDRDIADINLKIESDGFNATVSPSKTWKKFPVLRTTRKGGQKEYFEVKLTRKPNLPDGKYQINMTLFNGRDSSMIFKTVGIEEAADLQVLPAVSKAVIIDGAIKKEEWENSLLCSDFYSYAKRGYYYFSTILTNQPRVRMMADTMNLYISAKLEAGEILELIVASDRESKAKSIKINPASTKVDGFTNISIKTSADGTEIKIPFSALGVKGNSFFANIIVSKGDQISYWRGNSFSFNDPLVFAEITKK